MKFSLASIVALALVAVATAFVSPHTVLVYLWWAGGVLLINRLVLRRTDQSAVLWVYALYSLLAIVIFQFQLWTIPEYFGFSGGRGIGTDDSFFYSLVAYDLPQDFPTRFAVGTQRHNYGDVLGVLVAVHRRFFPSLHPLDLIFFNTAVLTFLPFAVRGIYHELFPGERGGRWAFAMMLVAPFVLANGVILMRDGLVATTLAAGLLAVMKKRWLPFLLMLAATAWLRPQNGVVLLGLAFVLGQSLARLDDNRAGWLYPTAGLTVALRSLLLVVVALAFVSIKYHLPWWEMLFRADFLRMSIGQSAALDTGTSTFYTISQLPWPLRVPLSFLFYLGSPFLALGELKAGGYWIPRSFLSNLFGLLFPVYAAWFYRAVLRAIRARHNGALILLALFVINLSLVSQVSMQLRHKIPLQPLFYVLVAYGATTPYHKDRSLGWLVAVVVIVLDLLVNGIDLLGVL